MQKLKILLVDDHKLFRKALHQLILKFNLHSELFEASNGQEAIDLLSKSTSIDVVLLDIHMPVVSGIEVMKQIKALKLKCQVIILTQFDEESLILYMLKLGAHGYLLKNCEPSELKDAILKTIRGEQYYSTAIIDVVNKSIVSKNGAANPGLSHREFQVLVLLKEGKSNKEMAGILNLTLRTIESYRKALMRKTNCRTGAELVGFAYRMGMV